MQCVNYLNKSQI